MNLAGKLNKDMLREKSHKERIVLPVLNQWIKTGKWNRICISGCSMKPILNDGSQVLVEHGRHSVKTGDIIIYLRDERLISHRVLRVIKDGDSVFYLTKGDSAVRFDRPVVGEEEITGIVRGIVKESKTIHLTGWRWRIFGKVMAASSLIVGISADIAHPLLGCIKAIRKKYRHHISE
jgi:signal peptidase I